MAKVNMKVIGDAPFRGVAPGGEVRVTMKDSRTYASQLQAIDAPKAPAKKAAAKKTVARKAPAKKAAGYSTRALKAR